MNIEITKSEALLLEKILVLDLSKQKTSIQNLLLNLSITDSSLISTAKNEIKLLSRLIKKIQFVDNIAYRSAVFQETGSIKETYPSDEYQHNFDF